MGQGAIAQRIRSWQRSSYLPVALLPHRPMPTVWTERKVLARGTRAYQFHQALEHVVPPDINDKLRAGFDVQ